MQHHPSITDVPGIRVGHWSDHGARTGTTVIVVDPTNVAAGEIRGGYPGAREIETLGSAVNTVGIDAIVFSGGSTYGLAAAEGVMRALEVDERGTQEPDQFYVPLVPALVVYDLSIGDGSVRPGPSEGEMAYKAADSSPVELGLVGAGTGTTAAKWRGLDAVVPGGIGSWSLDVDGCAVGALVVVNPVGDVFTLEGEALTGGSPVPPLVPEMQFGDRENTTLVAVAIDAAVTRPELLRILVRAHDALGACLRPAHTRWDGDGAIAVAVGTRRVDVDSLGEAAFVATGRALESALRATGRAAG